MQLSAQSFLQASTKKPSELSSTAQYIANSRATAVSCLPNITIIAACSISGIFIANLLVVVTKVTKK